MIQEVTQARINAVGLAKYLYLCNTALSPALYSVATVSSSSMHELMAVVSRLSSNLHLTWERQGS